MPRIRPSSSERGQVVIIVAVSLTVLVALVGVVIDGGFLWGKQRNTQNGADAASEAGAVVLAQNLAGVTPAKTDAAVRTAVEQAAAANGVIIEDAWYTNITGGLLNDAGATVGSTSSAAEVGGGLIPPGTHGVLAVAHQQVDTFLARIIGYDQFDVRADATAVAGYLTETCPSDAGCAVLPVTFPVSIVECDGTNKGVQLEDEWPAPSGVTIVPLCSNGPGNVGWLDWTPTAGGNNELRQVLEDGTSPAMSWPGWYYMTATGNTNNVEDVINSRYAGKIVQIPLFDLTCDTQPDSDPNAPDFGCPSGHVGGHGSNQWYHVGAMTSFQLCGPLDPDCTDPSRNSYSFSFTQAAYMDGGNPECQALNGATGCLVGKFKITVKSGTVSAFPSSTSDHDAVGVQLIR